MVWQSAMSPTPNAVLGSRTTMPKTISRWLNLPIGRRRENFQLAAGRAQDGLDCGQQFTKTIGLEQHDDRLQMMAVKFLMRYSSCGHDDRQVHVGGLEFPDQLGPRHVWHVIVSDQEIVADQLQSVPASAPSSAASTW